MRLKTLIDEIEEEYTFDYTVNQVNSDASKYVIENYEKTMIYLSRIRKFNFIENDINQLEEKCGSIFNSRTVRLIVPTSTKNEFVNRMNIIKGKLDTIKSIGEEFIKKEDETDINVKIPTNDLTEISKIFNEIDKALNQTIVNKKINGKVEVKKFETGSLWVGIGLGSVAAISLVGSMLWASQVIRKKFYEAELSRQYVDAIKDKNEDIAKARKLILSVIEKELDKEYDEECKKIIEENNLEEEGNEYSNKLKYALKTFNELSEKGVEFHPNQLAPEEVKNLFPTNQIIQKLLGDGK